MIGALVILAGFAASEGPAATPGGLPATPSISVLGTDLRALDTDQLQKYAADATAELDAVGGLLGVEPRVHLQVAPYFGMAPFDARANSERAHALRGRLDELGVFVEGDRGVVVDAERRLTVAVTRLWACATDCDAASEASTAATEAVTAEERRLAVLIEAAAAEAELIGFQLNFLHRVRDLLRIRERRASEPPDIDRFYESRGSDTQAPQWARDERDAREADELLALEAKKRKEVLLNNLGNSCETLDSWVKTRAGFDKQVKSASEELAKVRGAQEVANTIAVAYGTRISDLEASLEAGDPVAQQFDAMHAELTAKLTEAQSRVEGLRALAATAEKQLEEAERALRTARGNVPVLVTPLPDNLAPCSDEAKGHPDALAAAPRAAAAAVVGAETSSATLRRLRLETAQIQLNSEIVALGELRRVKRRVLPYLSPQRQELVYRYDANFFRELLGNVRLLLADAYGHLRTRVGQLKRAPAQISSLSGSMAVLTALFWLALILLVGRTALSQADRTILALWRAARARRSFQPVWDEIQHSLRLVSAIIRPALRLLIAWVVADYIGLQHAEVMAVYIVVEWVLLYRILRNASKTMFIAPPWTSERRDLFRPDLMQSPVFDRSPDVGRLSDRSMQLIIAYFIWRSAVLTTVDLLLGQDYLYHLGSDVVLVTQWMVIILLIVWWRLRVAAVYMAQGPAVGREFVERHANRHWFSIFVLPMTSVVLVRRIVPRLRETFGRTGPFRVVASLLSRRAMEAAVKTRTVDLPERPPLPERYRDVLRHAPLNNEEYVVAQIGPVQTVCDVYDFWCREKREGSIAIVGEAGMGKTTLVNQILHA
ncbi:MAG: hypothetical protein ACI9OJ_002820, partial [Myxococcota bacterium]